MANAPRCYASSVQVAVDAWCDRLNSGYLRIYSGGQPAVDAAVTGTLLATLTFAASAFANSTAAGGVVTATAAAIGSESNAVGGTAGYFALVMSNGTTVVATGSVSTSGADLNMSSLVITDGNTVSCSSFLVTQSQT